MNHYSAFKKLLVICIYAITVSSYAQNKRITLPDALKLAEANYPSIKAKQAGEQAAEMRVKSAKNDYLPDLITQNQINYATSNGMNGSFWSNGGYAIPTSGSIRPENVYTPVFGSFSTISLDWNVFNFGKVRNNVAYNKSEYEKSTAQYDEELFRHKIKVSDAYLLLLADEKVTQLQQRNYDRADGLYQSIKAFATSGIKPGTDSSYARAELSNAKTQLLTARIKEKDQKIALAELMGSDGTEFEIDTLQFLSSLPVIKEYTKPDIKKHPYLIPYAKEVNAGNWQAKRTMSSYYPSFTLHATGWARGSGVSNTNSDEFNQGFYDGVKYYAYNYMLAGTFVFNIMAYPKVRHDYKVQLFYIDQATDLYNEKLLQIKNESKKADSDLSLYIEQAKEAPIQLNSAQAAYLQSKARYDGGLATLPELAQNYYLLNRSEVDLSVAINTVWRSLLIQSAANGDMNIFLDALNNK